MIWRKQQYKEMRERAAQMAKSKRGGAPKASDPKRHDERGANQRNRLGTRKRAGSGGGEPVSKRQAKPREGAGARFMEKGGFRRNKQPQLGNFQQGGASSSAAPKAKAKPGPPKPLPAAPPPPPPPPRRNRSKKPGKKGG